MSAQFTWWLLASVTLAGAVFVLRAREMTRLLLSLGAFLLGLSGLYASYGFGMLAVSQLFVYVGGVLVLFLFAITAMGRDEEGRALGRRFDVGALFASAGLASVLVAVLSFCPPGAGAQVASVEASAAALLGPVMPAFEFVGVLLLAALVAALAIVQGGDE